MRRDDLLTVQVDGTQGTAVAGPAQVLGAARRRHAASRYGTPTSTARSTSSPAGPRCPTPPPTTTPSRSSGSCSCATSRSDALPLDAARRRQGRAARGARPALVARAPLARRWSRCDARCRARSRAAARAHHDHQAVVAGAGIDGYRAPGCRRSRSGGRRSRRGAARAARCWRSGLRVSALCRGGFFPATDAAGRQRAIDDNRDAIDEAAAIGAPQVVLVCGAVPGMPLAEARRQIARRHRGGAAVRARRRRAPGDRAAAPAVRRRPLGGQHHGQARRICEQVNAAGRADVGIAVDVYHVWWDDALEEELAPPAGSACCTPSTSATGRCGRRTCSTTAA